MAAGRRIRVWIGGSAVMVSATVAAFLALHDPTPATANLWVDQDGGACVRSASPAAYDDGDACGVDEAWQASSAGDSVVVKSADYGSVKFKQRAVPMTAPGVTFHMETGTHFDTIDIGCEIQSLGCLPVHADVVQWITLTGEKGRWDAEFLYFANASDIVVDGINVNRDYQVGKNVFWAGGNSGTQRTTIKNATICCNLNAPLMESWMATDEDMPNSDITIQDTLLGKMRRNDLGVHNECFLATATPGMTLMRTRWTGCNVMNINVGAFGPSAAISQVDYHWVNNVFESPTNQTEYDKTYFPWYQGCNAPDYDEAQGWVWEYNIFESQFYPCGGLNGAIIRGNVGVVGFECPAGATYSHNAFNISCSDTDTPAPDIISNAAAYFGGLATHEWWLKAGNPAIDAGDPGSYPADDITGLARPVGSAPDAGPNERP